MPMPRTQHIPSCPQTPPKTNKGYEPRTYHRNRHGAYLQATEISAEPQATHGRSKAVYEPRTFRRNQQAAATSCQVAVEELKPVAQATSIPRVPLINLDEVGSSQKACPSLDDVFKSWCGTSRDMDSRVFLKLCKRSCLVDKNMTSQDCHLIFSGTVPVYRHRMDFADFKEALSLVAVRKGLQESAVQRMVAWSQLPSADRDVQDSSEHAKTGRGDGGQDRSNEVSYTSRQQQRVKGPRSPQSAASIEDLKEGRSLATPFAKPAVSKNYPSDYEDNGLYRESREGEEIVGTEDPFSSNLKPRPKDKNRFLSAVTERSGR